MPININVNNSQGLQTADLNGLDLESSLMAVQTQRTNQLQEQMALQISAIQAKNDQISNLNVLLGVLNKAAASIKEDTKADAGVDILDFIPEIQDAAASAKIDLPSAIHSYTKTWTVTFTYGSQCQVTADQLASMQSRSNASYSDWQARLHSFIGPWGMRPPEPSDIITSSTANPSPIKKSDLDGFIQIVKSDIDSMSTSQQMDMLRLQGLTDKRNDAFDLMTKFIKKEQDNHETIQGTLR
jgi:hypothetical protein